MSFDEEMFYNASAYQNASAKATPEERKKLTEERERLYQRDTSSVYYKLARVINPSLNYGGDFYATGEAVKNIEKHFKDCMKQEVANIYKDIHVADTLNRHNHATAAKDLILMAKELRELKERVEISDHDLNQKCRTSIALLSNEINEMKEVVEHLLEHLEELEKDEEEQEKEEEENPHPESDPQEDYASLIVSVVFLGLLGLTMLFVPLLQVPEYLLLED